MINRKEIIEYFSPNVHNIDLDAPFTLGNGSFSFTADVTGLQTLYTDYDTDGGFPLCSLSQWGWNRHYLKEKYYPQREELVLTNYETPIDHHIVKYPVDIAEGNEEIYDWFRKNPHRCNLYRIGFRYNNLPIGKNTIKNVSQKLDLYQGMLFSEFQIEGHNVQVETFVSQIDDSLCFRVKSELDLQICLEFPYSNWTKNGSDWNNTSAHQTMMMINQNKNRIDFDRRLNDFRYCASLQFKEPIVMDFDTTQHRFIASIGMENEFSLLVSPNKKSELVSVNTALKENKNYWENFWTSTGFVNVMESTDKRAEELQRRIILSKYLLQIQSNSYVPPQETGLSCNSWYGKFHLEMHLWHTGYLPTWNQENDLKRALPWYREHLAEAKKNALINGYQGARWPKMVGNDVMDSPSKIAPLLIWQQTHVIYLINQIYNVEKDLDFVRENYDLVEETMNFVTSFLVYDEKSEKYIIQPPLMASQEVFDALKIYNPTFELEYWRFALKTAISWAKLLEKECSHWGEVLTNLALVDEQFSFYPAYEGEKDTFALYNRDHPSFVGIYGLIDDSSLNSTKVALTLDKVLNEWEYDELWGWDYAMLAMVATKLNQPQKAIDILLSDTEKNQYLVNGNNFQKLTNNPKNYLPVYLPGNGSLLLAISLMVSNNYWGFPKKTWKVEKENMNEWPYK